MRYEEAVSDDSPSGITRAKKSLPTNNVSLQETDIVAEMATHARALAPAGSR